MSASLLSRNQARLLVFLTCVFVMGADAFGFEVDGFNSSMTKDEVALKLTAQGLTFQSIGDYALSVSHAVIKSDLDFGPFFEFCSSKLASYTKQLPFDEELVGTMDSLTSVYGDPSKSETFVTFQDMKDVPAQKAFRVVWLSNDDTIYLEIVPETRDQFKKLLLGRKIVLKYLSKKDCN